MNINFQNNISQDQAFDWEKIIVEMKQKEKINSKLLVRKVLIIWSFILINFEDGLLLGNYNMLEFINVYK